MGAELDKTMRMVGRCLGTNIEGMLGHLWRGRDKKTRYSRTPFLERTMAVRMLWLIFGVGAETLFAQGTIHDP